MCICHSSYTAVESISPLPWIWAGPVTSFWPAERGGTDAAWTPEPRPQEDLKLPPLPSWNTVLRLPFRGEAQEERPHGRGLVTQPNTLAWVSPGEAKRSTQPIYWVAGIDTIVTFSLKGLGWLVVQQEIRGYRYTNWILVCCGNSIQKLSQTSQTQEQAKARLLELSNSGYLKRGGMGWEPYGMLIILFLGLSSDYTGAFTLW